jgi:hypothetical protein
MPDIEAVGEAATGAVLARTVEPGSGEGNGRTHERNCLNCGCALQGDYCHCCGQKAHVHRTLKAFGHDLAHGVTHLDGKIWRTLPLLAWRPGELTRRYTLGERAKFVSPIALFLFSVFLMFAVFSWLGSPVTTGATVSRNEAAAEMEPGLRQSQAELAALRSQRAELASAGGSTAEIDGDIAAKQNEVAIQQRISRGFLPERDAIVTLDGRPAGEENFVLVSGADSANDWLNDAYRKAKRNPQLLIYKLQTNAYKFSWLLIPISIPLVWLLFLHRRRYRAFTAYDHTVFVTYSLAFVSLLAIIGSVAVSLGFNLLMIALMAFIPVHMFRQLKGAYELSTASALWRTVALTLISWFALAVFGLAILTLGIS